MRELRTHTDLKAAAGGDLLIVWAAQGMRPGVRAWASGDSVVVACPDLSRRHRIAVRGDAPTVATLVREALRHVGPAYRPFGDIDLIKDVVARLPELEFSAQFGWMDTGEALPSGAALEEKQTTESHGDSAHGDSAHGDLASPDPSPGVEWLKPDMDPEVTALLEVAAPKSYAWPGVPWIRRWAGVRDPAGQLVAVAADAWPAPEVGFIAGVATHPQARGRGYARAVCRMVRDSLLADHGRVALMVDDDNAPAIALYRSLGMRWRPVAAAQVRHSA